MSCRSIMDPVQGYGASVDSSGNLHVSVAGVVAPVQTQPSPMDVVETLTPTVGTSSGQLIGANAARRQIDIQNLSGTRAIHILLSGSGSATSSHLRIDPGARYSFPPGVCYTGAIQAIAIDGTAAAVVQEFRA